MSVIVSGVQFWDMFLSRLSNFRNFRLRATSMCLRGEGMGWRTVLTICFDQMKMPGTGRRKPPGRALDSTGKATAAKEAVKQSRMQRNDFEIDGYPVLLYSTLRVFET